MPLALLILQIVLQLMNVAMIIYKKWDKWNEEQRALMMKRYQTVLETLQQAVNGAHDGLNEDAFLKLQDDENQLRYRLYRPIILDALKEGYGYEYLSTMPDVGIGVRVKMCQAEVIRILTLVLSTEQKAQFIAAELLKW